MFKRITYKIRGLDCSEEVSALQGTVGKLPGVKNLHFNILNASMTLDVDLNISSEKDIFNEIRNAGLEVFSGKSMEGDTFWKSKGRTVMCLSGLCFLLAGIIFYSIHHGNLIIAFTDCGSMGKHTFPLYSIIFFSLSIILSLWNVIPRAYLSLKNFKPDMNLLMTIAITGAIITGDWLEASTIGFLFSLALMLESWSVEKARKAISELMDLSPKKARYLCPHHGQVEEKPVENIAVGSIVMVKPGERIPLDGVLTKGTTSVNQSPITGESLPVFKCPGDEVFAGTINGEGSVEIKVTKPYYNTTLSRIIHMVEEAQSRKAPVEQWVEKFAFYYTPGMMFFSVIILFVNLLLFDVSWQQSLYRSLVFLVIACPCAFVISTPVAVVAGLTSAARNGILIKGGVYLELPARLKFVVLDKTGTLTYGQPVVQKVIPFNNNTCEDVLKRAASLEIHSEHPLAKAILKKVEEDGVKFNPATDFQSVRGKGATAFIDGNFSWLGSHKFMEEMVANSHDFSNKAKEFETMGYTVVATGDKENVYGFIAISDSMRENSPDFIKALKNSGISRVIMLTGDNEATAKTLAVSAGIDEFKAGLLPEEKMEILKELMKEVKYVAMTGDGVNDAPAMAEAILGIAMGGMGTDATIETADIVLMSDDLMKIPWLIRHSRRTLGIIKQNVVFALVVKILFMALSMAGLATLWMAILADTGASLLVIFNGLRLLGSKKDMQV